MHNTWPGGLNLPPIKGRPRRRIAALPVGPDYFAESILTGKPYALKAIMTCGNPLLGSANTKKVAEAFKKLDFYVYTGLFMEESAYYADVILPACSGLEMETVYMRRDDRAIRWQQQAVARVGESKPDWEIWIDLAHAMAKVDRKNPPEYWTANFPAGVEGLRQALGDVRGQHAGDGRHDAGADGEEGRAACGGPARRSATPASAHLYLDHPSWYEAAAALDPANKGKRFLTPSGKIELFTPELEAKLSPSGHAALPTFYTHPEVTGRNPSIAYSDELVTNPVNPQAVTPRVRLGEASDGKVHEQFPLMGIIGRPSVVHFAGVTQWTFTGKQMNGVRLIQIHPKAAAKAGVADGDAVVVESPRGAVEGTAVLWEGHSRGHRLRA